MESKQSEHTNKFNGYRWLLIPLLLLLLLWGIRQSLQSDWLLATVQERTVQMVNSRLDGTLTISEVRGDLLSGVVIEGIELRDREGVRILQVDSVSLEYSLVNLIREQSLNRLQIDGVEAELIQQESGVWNVESLVHQGDSDVDSNGGLPGFSVENLGVNRLRLRAVSGNLPEGVLSVNDLSLRASVDYRDGEWTTTMGDLRFLLEEGRIPGGIDIGLSAEYRQDELTLERLLAGTGRSLIQLEGRASTDGPVEGVMRLSPLSLEDVANYLDVAATEDLTGEVTVSGSMESIRLGMSLSAPGVERFSASVRLLPGREPEMTELNVKLEGFRGEEIAGLEPLPSVRLAELQLSGRIPLGAYKEGELTGSFRADGVEAEGFELKHITTSVVWNQQNLDAKVLLDQDSQQVAADVRITDLFGEQPAWSLLASAENLDLRRMTSGHGPESDLTMELEADGEGFRLSEIPVSIGLSVRESWINGQQVDLLTVSGSVSDRTLEAMAELSINQSRLDLVVDALEWREDGEYSFRAALSRFNLNDINGMEGFPTHLNATLSGSGWSFDPQEMALSAQVEFDSSRVNREEIETLRADLEISDQMVTVREATLRSPIADASFSLDHHIQNIRFSENRLSFELDLKNTQPLAPLFQVGYLQATGQFSGELARLESGNLRFAGDLDLEEVNYDQEYEAEQLEGSVRADLLEEPIVQLQFGAVEPLVKGFRFDRAEMNLNLSVQPAGYEGELSLGLNLDEGSHLEHSSVFQIADGSLALTTGAFKLQSPERTLHLQTPFALSFSDGILEMETFHIESNDGAYLQLTIPRLAPDRKVVEMESSEVNMGTLQQLLFGERYAEALMSGSFSLDAKPDTLTSEMSLLFEGIEYRQGRADSLRLGLSLADRRLQVRAGAWNEEEQKLNAQANLPFQPGDPETFTSGFFQQPVEGEIQIPASSLSFWTAFLPGHEQLSADGVFSFRSELSGGAGSPQFEGHFELVDAAISGVPVSRADLEFDYRHENSRIDLVGGVYSRETPVAYIEADLPLYLDMQRPGVDMPSDRDSVSVDVRTERFDLALLNEFLNPDVLRGLRGRVDGEVQLHGSIGELEADGNFEIQDGAVQVVPAGVQLTEIRSGVLLQRDRFELSSFHMRSGPGRVNASGSVEMNGLQPGVLSLAVEASQFRAMNTERANVILDLNSKLEGTVEQPRLTGGVDLRSGFIMLQNFGEESVEEVRLEGEEETEPLPFYDDLAMEMNLSVDRQFFIRNRQYLDMEVELGGNVDLVKEPQGDVQLFGTVEGVRGYARPLGRNFEIDEAAVSFFGPATNPDLQIRTFYNPPRSSEEITIWYIIEGSAEDPEFRFESDPFLELQDIISYTVFGQPFYALDSWQQALSGGGGAGASDLAMELLLDRFGTLASQQLGIDVVQIENNRTSSGSSTTIKTGWYLTDRTFFAVLNEIGSSTPKTLFMLEYLLSENLELLITQGDDIREGVDIRWQYDY